MHLSEFVYYRLHGAPIKYESAYKADRLVTWAKEWNAIADRGIDVYGIFGNMAHFGGTANALQIRNLLAWDRWAQDTTGKMQWGTGLPGLFTKEETGESTGSLFG